MKDYFIGQGTLISAQFDTLEEMLAYHAAMPDLDRHFCKLIPGGTGPDACPCLPDGQAARPERKLK